MSDLPICACGEFYQAHHPECPARRAFEEALSRLDAAAKLCEVYWNIASQYMTDDAIRSKRDAMIDQSIAERKALEDRLSSYEYELAQCQAALAQMRGSAERAVAQAKDLREANAQLHEQLISQGCRLDHYRDLTSIALQMCSAPTWSNDGTPTLGDLSKQFLAKYNEKVPA